MAKIILEIEDDDTGGITLVCKADSVLPDFPDKRSTHAQNMAVVAILTINANAYGNGIPVNGSVPDSPEMETKEKRILN